MNVLTVKEKQVHFTFEELEHLAKDHMKEVRGCRLKRVEVVEDGDIKYLSVVFHGRPLITFQEDIG